MPRRKGRPISFDAMVKFFMQNYNIPTKKDVDHLMAKLDRLESLINNLAMGSYSAKAPIGRRKPIGVPVGIAVSICVRVTVPIAVRVRVAIHCAGVAFRIVLLVFPSRLRAHT